MELIRPRAQALLAPLRHRGFRRFFGGQLVSTIGTWMQVVGQAWLVLELTHSALLLGVVSALQWSPTLLLSLPAGVLADRVPKRTLVLATQTSSALLAAVLGTLTFSDGSATGTSPPRRRFSARWARSTCQRGRCW